MERGELLVEVVGDPDTTRAFLIDVQRMEQSLVQPASLVFVAASVERLRVVEQLEAGLDQLGSGLEVFVRCAQAGGKPLPLQGDLVQLGADLGSWQTSICRQIDEVGLLRVQRSKLLGELAVEEFGGMVLFIHEASELGAKFSDELGREANRGVVGFDGILDPVDLGVGQLAGVVITTRAEEVVVSPPLAVDGLLEDHAAPLTVSPEAGAAE